MNNRRNTKQKALVYETVMKNCNHPNADEVYEEIHKNNPSISKGTVYRNLNLLSENGEIKQVKVPGISRYDNRLDNHYHVVCRLCQKVLDVPLKYQDEFDAKVAEDMGFKIERHRTVFEGICPDCLKSSGKE